LSVIRTGPQLRDAIEPLRHPTRISGASGPFFRLSLARPAPGFSSRTVPSRPPAAIHDVRSIDFVTSLARTRPETTAQANDSERRVARVSREIASKAPEIPAGRQRSRDLRLSPTGRDRTGAPSAAPALGWRCDFPRRLACERRSGFWPNHCHVTNSGDPEFELLKGISLKTLRLNK
jgi:hypothetical protein